MCANAAEAQLPKPFFLAVGGPFAVQELSGRQGQKKRLKPPIRRIFFSCPVQRTMLYPADAGFSSRAR